MAKQNDLIKGAIIGACWLLTFSTLQADEPGTYNTDTLLSAWTGSRWAYQRIEKGIYALTARTRTNLERTKKEGAVVELFCTPEFAPVALDQIYQLKADHPKRDFKTIKRYLGMPCKTDGQYAYFAIENGGTARYNLDSGAGKIM